MREWMTYHHFELRRGSYPAAYGPPLYLYIRTYKDRIVKTERKVGVEETQTRIGGALGSFGLIFGSMALFFNRCKEKGLPGRAPGEAARVQPE